MNAVANTQETNSPNPPGILPIPLMTPCKKSKKKAKKEISSGQGRLVIVVVVGPLRASRGARVNNVKELRKLVIDRSTTKTVQALLCVGLDVETAVDGVAELLLALFLLFLQEHGVAGTLVVDTALGLVLALPAAGTLVLGVGHGLRRVPVTDAAVALVQEGVGRDVVFFDVGLDFFEGPVGERVDLDEALVVNVDDVDVTALAALCAATASHDRLDVKFAVGAVGGLHLGYGIVEFVVGFPETLAVLGFEVGGSLAVCRLEGVDFELRVVLSYAVDKLVGLLEVVEGVEEDEIDIRLDRVVELCNHVHDSETGQTKS